MKSRATRDHAGGTSFRFFGSSALSIARLAAAIAAAHGQSDALTVNGHSFADRLA
jgi:hypothetical protein